MYLLPFILRESLSAAFCCYLALIYFISMTPGGCQTQLHAMWSLLALFNMSHPACNLANQPNIMSSQTTFYYIVNFRRSNITASSVDHIHYLFTFKYQSCLSLVTYSSGEAWTDTKWNAIWQVIKKCFGMLHALWAGLSTPRSQVEDIRPEMHAN